MKRTVIASLALGIATSTLTAAQETPPDLARARTAFAKADADKSGSITLTEAQASGHTPSEFRVFDLDGDGKLTQNEFLVGYKERMTSRGRRVAPDLENEARRVLAKHRSEQAEASRRRGAGGEDGPAKRRSEALKEKVQASDQDPARLRNQLQKKKAAKGTSGAENGTPARSKATGALSGLQDRVTGSTSATNSRDGAAPTPARPSTRATTQRPVPSPATNDAKADGGANAGPVDGPATRRIGRGQGVTPEELQRLLRERRKRAALDQQQDPRQEDAKRRARERAAGSEAERASERDVRRTRSGNRGSTSGRGGASGRSSGVRSRGGSSRGGNG